MKPLLDLIKVKGGTPLQGSIKASGAKNSITKLLVASLLSDKKSVFYNVPNILDVEITACLCEEVGAKISWDKSAHVLEICTKELKTSYISQKFSGANRIPILMLGALLGRTSEEVIVPTVGGDLLGNRPLNFHIEALRKMGAHVEYRPMKKEGAYFGAAHQGLFGNVIELPYPSVGATENILLAASKAKGRTVIKNGALEPEVMDLILFLQKMGVFIYLERDATIFVEAPESFKEASHTIVFDRNEIVSYASAAISTKGSIFIEGASQMALLPFLNELKKIGAGFSVEKNGILFFYDKPLKGGLHIQTDVHPGFMTDWQQLFVPLLTQCEGTSVIHETVYEKRFGYTKILQEMGADLSLFTQCLGNKPCRFSLLDHKHSLVIKGPTPLKSHNISIPDLRAGFAYLIAALVAEGTSTISNAIFLDRGYDSFVEKLTSLGAQIERVPLSTKERVSV